MKLGSSNLRQANNEKLQAKLGVTSGAVTPLAVCNNTEKDVTVVIERSLLTGATVNYHPLVQNQTTALSPIGLLKYLKHLGFEPLLISLGAEPALAPEVDAFLKQMGTAVQGKKQQKAAAAPQPKKEKKSKKKAQSNAQSSAEGAKKGPAVAKATPWPSARPKHYMGLNDADAARLSLLRAGMAQKEATRYMVPGLR